MSFSHKNLTINYVKLHYASNTDMQENVQADYINFYFEVFEDFTKPSFASTMSPEIIMWEIHH